MGDAEAPEGALELAERIAVVVAGAWPKEAQAVGINDFGKAPFSEGFPEVLEMVLCRIGSHEATREVESGVIVNGEQQGLLGRCRPPLVDGAVVLPELSDVSAAEAAVGAGLARAGGHQVSEVFLDVSLDVGARAFEIAKPVEFIRHELIVGGTL